MKSRSRFLYRLTYTVTTIGNAHSIQTSIHALRKRTIEKKICRKKYSTARAYDSRAENRGHLLLLSKRNCSMCVRNQQDSRQEFIYILNRKHHRLEKVKIFLCEYDKTCVFHISCWMLNSNNNNNNLFSVFLSVNQLFEK